MTIFLVFRRQGQKKPAEGNQSGECSSMRNKNSFSEFTIMGYENGPTI